MHIEFNNLKDLLIFNIKYFRYMRNLSQEKLAELCSLTPRYIIDVERGLHCPTIPKTEVISKVFGIEPYQLFVNIDRDSDIIDRMNKGRQYNQKH